MLSLTLVACVCTLHPLPTYLIKESQALPSLPKFPLQTVTFLSIMDKLHE